MSSEMTPKYLQEELSQEWEELISRLPRERGWAPANLYQYQGFWYSVRLIKGVISCQKHFQTQDSDVFLISTPKSGTTWLKATMFTLLNRKRYPVMKNHQHPLLNHNPHDLVASLESWLYAADQIPADIASFPSPRLFSTHMPYVSLPESVKNSSSSSSAACKLVYLCRNPKDTFVSSWHFMNKIRPQDAANSSIGEAFDLFCKGVSRCGPFWDHVLQYWKQSKDNPARVLFLKYEDMKEHPGLQLRRLAEFLDCPFSTDEEDSGLVDEILKLCSFENLSSLAVNKNGRISIGIETNSFFRKGEVGDWKNHLNTDMVEKLDQITEEKFRGSGLVF